jgi:XTP/dITP diphosphohydrolase
MISPVIIGFATTNPHKLRETEQCVATLWPEAKVVAVPPSQEVAETGKTFLENAKIKLEACLSDKLPDEVTFIIVEDAGLIIEALEGYQGLSPFPGLYSDRWFSPEVQQSLFGQVVANPDYQHKNAGILKLMENQTNRNARYEACVVGWDRKTGKIIDVTGTVPLQVADAPQGEAGFGYDPIMIPVTYDATRTMAELRSEEKNAISHRYHALSQLIEKLKAMSSSPAAS